MAVLGDDCIWVELDDGERLAVAVNRACDHGVPDLDHRQFLKVVEPGQAVIIAG
jgi:hypothetical protein